MRKYCFRIGFGCLGPLTSRADPDPQLRFQFTCRGSLQSSLLMVDDDEGQLSERASLSNSSKLSVPQTRTAPSSGSRGFVAGEVSHHWLQGGSGQSDGQRMGRILIRKFSFRSALGEQVWTRYWM